MKMKNAIKRYIKIIRTHLDIRFPIGAILGVGIMVWAFYQLSLDEPFGIGIMRNPWKELFYLLVWWYGCFFASSGFIYLGWIGFKKTIFKNTKRQTYVAKILSYKDGSYILAETSDGTVVKLTGFDPDKTPHCFCQMDFSKYIPVPTEIYYEGETAVLYALSGYKTARRCFLKKRNHG